MEAAARAEQGTEQALVAVQQADQPTGHRLAERDCGQQRDFRADCTTLLRLPMVGSWAITRDRLSHQTIEDMAKSKAKVKAKPAPARKAAKPVATKKAVARKPVAKKAAVARKPAPAKAKAKAPVAKKPLKPAVASKAKVVAKKPLAKKAAPVKPAAKPAAVKKPVTAHKQPSTPSKKAAAGHAAPSKPSVKASTQKIEGNVAKGVKRPPQTDTGATMQDGRYALPANVQIPLPKGYKPLAKEEYMGPRHLQYFRDKLSNWREELVEESRQTIESLRDEVRDVGDEAERATRETENSLELRTRDRYRKLIAKIDKALKRIEEGHYGFCEETDEEIGIDRLEARPIATLSLDAQERWEHRQKQMGD